MKFGVLMQEAAVGVQIRVTDGLPPAVPLAADFGPGHVHLAVSDTLSLQDACDAITEAWQAIRDHYGIDPALLAAS